MSLQPEAIPTIPEETVRVARAIWPQGNRYMHLREELGTLYTDELFTEVYPAGGSYAEAPWRLALVTVMQYMENLSDRQAAEAVRTRIDWKYVLSLELTDPGFDFSVLCDFRQRLLTSGQEECLLTTVVEVCRKRGWIKERGQQRTDSTHVLAAIRTLNRLECVGETLRAALNSLAVVAPQWLRGWVPRDWYERYAMRSEEFRLPKEASKRQAMAEQIGADGWQLLTAIYWVESPSWLREVPAVETLRGAWVQQYQWSDDTVCWRANDNIPPASLLISSPYDPDAHLSIKRSTVWTGYKVHLTETCDEDAPHLLVHVETTPATTQDMEMTGTIHEALAEKHLLPAEQFMDTGYVDGPHIVECQAAYQVDLVGPVTSNASWQAHAGDGYDTSAFHIDWDQHIVTCPQGKTSRKWTLRRDHHGSEVIRAQFGKHDCLTCPCRAQCTSAPVNPRQITFRLQAQHEAIQAARQRQTTSEFKHRYATRAGVEGTISQGVRVFDLRRSRYRGHAKTHLQHLIIAAAMNVTRILAWTMQLPRGGTRISRFAALAL